ncbi:hypothetical protein [Streptomyces sp. NPDC048411]|uniref:hypothetical protein n=1 Tax=Streptomyces sp. NPDC048411 TaxID=3157206 RepID=UPI0034563951
MGVGPSAARGPSRARCSALLAVGFADRARARGRALRAVPVRANGQPALACYLPTPPAPIARPYGLLVLSADRDAITAITWFGDTSIFPAFGLPRSLPDERPGKRRTGRTSAPS